MGAPNPLFKRVFLGSEDFGTRPFHSPSLSGMRLYFVRPHFPSPKYHLVTWATSTLVHDTVVQYRDTPLISIAILLQFMPLSLVESRIHTIHLDHDTAPIYITILLLTYWGQSLLEHPQMSYNDNVSLNYSVRAEPEGRNPA